MKPKIVCLIINFLLLFACKKEESVTGAIDQQIERIAKKYIVYGRTPGVIVGTIKDGEKKIYSYGVANLNSGASIDEFTIFEIGSITKTFTGILAAQFVLQGKLSLQDTVNHYLPLNMQLPSKNDIPIKWAHLLNHTSGLEREPNDLNIDEPFDYAESQMSAYLSRANLLTTPGTKMLYSNSGIGLASFALAKIADSSYASLIENRIFSKLNMTHSFCDNDEKPPYNTAQGYYGNKSVDYYKWSSIFLGAGGIKSNMHDMLIYLQNCIYPETSVLKDEINLSFVPTFQVQDKLNMGLGWFLGLKDNNEQTVFHDGGTKGASSFMGFNRDKKIGVVVLINSYCISEQNAIGAEIMELLEK